MTSDPNSLQLCPCGEPLTLEFERDVGTCANCMAEARETETESEPTSPEQTA